MHIKLQYKYSKCEGIEDQRYYYHFFFFFEREGTGEKGSHLEKLKNITIYVTDKIYNNVKKQKIIIIIPWYLRCLRKKALTIEL